MPPSAAKMKRPTITVDALLLFSSSGGVHAVAGLDADSTGSVAPQRQVAALRATRRPLFGHTRPAPVSSRLALREVGESGMSHNKGRKPPVKQPHIRNFS